MDVKGRLNDRNFRTPSPTRWIRLVKGYLIDEQLSAHPIRNIEEIGVTHFERSWALSHAEGCWRVNAGCAGTNSENAISIYARNVLHDGDGQNFAHSAVHVGFPAR